MVQINAYNSTITTNISMLSHALQRKILVLQHQCVGVCAARGAAGEKILIYIPYIKKILDVIFYC